MAYQALPGSPRLSLGLPGSPRLSQAPPRLSQALTGSPSLPHPKLPQTRPRQRQSRPRGVWVGFGPGSGTNSSQTTFGPQYNPLPSSPRLPQPSPGPARVIRGPVRVIRGRVRVAIRGPVSLGSIRGPVRVHEGPSQGPSGAQ